jgi:hypothetical protein
VAQVVAAAALQQMEHLSLAEVGVVQVVADEA